MIKYKYILTPVILLLLGILIWRTSMLFANKAAMFSNSGTSSELSTKTNRHEETISINELSQNSDNRTDNNDAGYHETIEEAIARVKRDVIVTGTITGTPGRELAMFQIEGMADRLFRINTQLMGGFIIKEITKSNVVLTNQVGNEAFSLHVQSGGESLNDSSLENGFNNASADPNIYNPQQFSDGGTNTIFSLLEYPEITEEDPPSQYVVEGNSSPGKKEDAHHLFNPSSDDPGADTLVVDPPYVPVSLSVYF